MLGFVLRCQVRCGDSSEALRFNLRCSKMHFGECLDQVGNENDLAVERMPKLKNQPYNT